MPNHQQSRHGCTWLLLWCMAYPAGRLRHADATRQFRQSLPKTDLDMTLPLNLIVCLTISVACMMCRSYRHSGGRPPEKLEAQSNHAL
mmetsp:Transcript_62324/g.146270  ORF Transcript_62324/g.146270 Transcript_62324/m.146270 type:complete len:88 (-) Transcript_62324:1395-1658(-)